MREFKHGDYIIYENELYYVSYYDVDGDFIFLTNSERNNHDFIEKLGRSEYFSEEEILLIKEEAKKLKFKYYFYPTTQTKIKEKFKFATKYKLKNILNR